MSGVPRAAMAARWRAGAAAPPQRGGDVADAVWGRPYHLGVSAYLDAQRPRRGLGLRRPPSPSWGQLALGVTALAVVVAAARGLVMEDGESRAAGGVVAAARSDGAAVRIPLQPSPGRQAEAARRFVGFVVDGQLTPDQAEQVSAVMAELRNTWVAALAYFDALEEPDERAVGAVGMLSRAHLVEVQALIHDAAIARLGGLLTPAQLALLVRRLGPLSAYVAATPAVELASASPGVGL
jgi:hypothetical protein